MLELRPNCECCGISLSASSSAAYICSFECTFCGDCSTNTLRGTCPNCGGELLRRPARSEALLMRYPASSEIIIKQAGCVSRSAAAVQLSPLER
jgi:uncharacterized protein